MIYNYELFPEKTEYQSLLVINHEQLWRETLFFSFYTPWDGNKEILYAGRAMSDLHFKDKPVECVMVFDFHRWDSSTIDKALKQEAAHVAFNKTLRQHLESALERRDGVDDGGFRVKVKD